MTHNSVFSNDESGEQMGTWSARIVASVTLTALITLLIPATSFAYTLTNFKKVAPQIADNAETNFGDIVNIAALLHDYDEKMIISVIVVESEGKKNALSNKGAQGLMQLMPKTAKAMGAKDPNEPFQNILAGTKYLKHLEDDYGFTPKEALVAYNMGPTRAKRWLTQYSPDESIYVQKVMHVYGVLVEEEKELVAKSVENPERELASTGILTKPRAITLAELPTPNGVRRVEEKSEDK